MQGRTNNEMANGDETRPVPDPTILSTQALERESAGLKDMIDLRASAVEKLLAQKVDCEAEIREEQLNGVNQQLHSMEKQRVEQKEDTKAAVDAALSAQQEAVKEQTIASERAIAKSENATTKSIEQVASTLQVTFDGMRRDIDDLKGRLGVSEGQQSSRRQHDAESQAWQIWVAGAAVTIALAVVIILTGG